MVDTGPGRTGSLWRHAKAQCMATAEALNKPCAICGEPIDWQLTRANCQHAMAATVHHIISLHHGGHPHHQSNLAPAHRGCNTRISNETRGITNPFPPIPTTAPAPVPRRGDRRRKHVITPLAVSRWW